MSRFHAGKLLLATQNKGKLAEMRAFMAPFGVELVSAGELNLPQPSETGVTYIENARIKARAGVVATGLPTLADDSGLCVDALEGAPGVYSANWAGEPRDYQRAIARVYAELIKVSGLGPPAPKARFCSVLLFLWPDGHEDIFEGIVEGSLQFPAKGENGFGYDPIFVPENYTQTFGELGMDIKNCLQSDGNCLSHRARALAKFKNACLTTNVV